MFLCYLQVSQFYDVLFKWNHNSIDEKNEKWRTTGSVQETVLTATSI